MITSPRCFRLLLPLPLLTIFAHGAGASDLPVPNEQIEALGIRLVEVAGTESQPLAVLPATVIPAAKARTLVPLPFSGTIVKTHVMVGQDVKKGQDIATISSQDFHEIQAKIIESDAELMKAKLNAERQRILADKKVIASNDALEAEELVQKIRTIGAEFKDHAESFGLRKVDEFSFVVVSPADGKVVELSAVNEKADATAGIAMLRTSAERWLEVQISVDLVARTQVGDRVEIDGKPAGNVISIGSAIDRLTRSATMLVSLPHDTDLVEGQNVSVTILGQVSKSASAVPAAAVTFINGKPSVFLRTAQGFKKLEVTLLGKSPLVATVSGDLTAGQLVAASRLPELENLVAVD